MDSFTLDDKFKSIEEILKKLEKDDIGIEEALELYTNGKVLVEQCKEKIDMVEKEVQKINPDQSLEKFETDEF